MTPCRAVILAAGMGTRLRSVVDDRPKGLIEIDGETLVGRSVRLLRDHGITEITIVAGYRAEQYDQFASGQRDLRILRNDAFDSSGSLASLAVALERVSDPILVLESDIVYEARALTTLLGHSADDSTLLSGATGAGDEVWVDGSDGRLRAMSKDRRALSHVTGEFVGITRLSAEGCALMRKAFRHARTDYETDGLVEVGQVLDIAVVLVPDLCWGEIDDDRQLDRVVRRVWPGITRAAL